MFEKAKLGKRQLFGKEFQSSILSNLSFLPPSLPLSLPPPWLLPFHAHCRSRPPPAPSLPRPLDSSPNSDRILLQSGGGGGNFLQVRIAPPPSPVANDHQGDGDDGDDDDDDDGDDGDDGDGGDDGILEINDTSLVSFASQRKKKTVKKEK